MAVTVNRYEVCNGVRRRGIATPAAQSTTKALMRNTDLPLPPLGPARDL
jgi:hypothetical protein